MQAMGAPLADIFDAAKDAGHQLIEKGVMSADTLNAISRPLLSAEDYATTINQRFQQAHAQERKIQSNN